MAFYFLVFCITNSILSRISLNYAYPMYVCLVSNALLCVALINCDCSFMIVLVSSQRYSFYISFFKKKQITHLISFGKTLERTTLGSY